MQTQDSVVNEECETLYGKVANNRKNGLNCLYAAFGLTLYRLDPEWRNQSHDDRLETLNGVRRIARHHTFKGIDPESFSERTYARYIDTVWKAYYYDAPLSIAKEANCNQLEQTDRYLKTMDSPANRHENFIIAFELFFRNF